MSLITWFLIFNTLIINSKFSNVVSVTIDECCKINKLNDDCLVKFSKTIIPSLEGKHKGEAGKIAVVGGSVEYTGAPYFAAISALKVGADLVTVLTTENAAPVIKSYSPDLIVIPHHSINISKIIPKNDLIVIGPGLGRSEEALHFAYNVISLCKELKIPLVIDADGLYAVYKNISILKDYPNPGIILTPNKAEAKRLQDAIGVNYGPWYRYWGDYVTVLEKGGIDQFHSSQSKYSWCLQEGGSGRRAGGQGDILSGAMGTFFNWAIKSNICGDLKSFELAPSVASYAAAKFTRLCNFKAYKLNGRNMIASDMLKEIHSAFDDLFL